MESSLLCPQDCHITGRSLTPSPICSTLPVENSLSCPQGCHHRWVIYPLTRLFYPLCGKLTILPSRLSSQVGHLPPHPSVLPSLWKTHYPALKAVITGGSFTPSPVCSTLSVENSLSCPQGCHHRWVIYPLTRLFYPLCGKLTILPSRLSSQVGHLPPHPSVLPSLWKTHYPALKAVITGGSFTPSPVCSTLSVENSLSCPQGCHHRWVIYPLTRLFYPLCGKLTILPSRLSSQVGHLPPHPSVLPSLWKAHYPALKAVISQVGHLPPHPSVLPSLWKAHYPALKAVISQVGHLPPHPSVLPSLWKAHYPALKAVISQVGHLPPHPSVLPSLWKAHYPALKAVISQVGHLPPHPSVLPSLWKTHYSALKAVITGRLFTPSPVCSTLSVENSLSCPQGCHHR